VESNIINSYTDLKKCWARPPFKTSEKVKNGKDTVSWECIVCNRSYAISDLTTSNVRKHLTISHPDLAQKLQLKLTGAESLISCQTHLSKKGKIAHFTEKGLNESLIKYSVLTDQSFLNVEHPVF
jgi:hypothetical protein